MTTGLASVTDNRTFIQKADLALSDLTSSGGLLLPAQAQKFIRILIEEAKLMPMTTVVPMRSPKQLIEKIRFGSRILRAGQEAQPIAEGDRAKPDLGKVELDAKLFKGEVRLNDEVLEDNIERAELRTTIMQLLGERISVDMEEVAVRGDINSADPFLAQLDGIIKQATSHGVAAGGVSLNKTVLRDMLKAMPKEYLRGKDQMRYLTSVDAEIDYRDAIADRATVLGDKFLEQADAIRYGGIPIEAIQMFPENLVGGNETVAMFLDPKNIQWGIWRNIKIETDKLVSEGVLLVVVTLRMDVKFAQEDAVVKATGITVS